MLFLTLLLCFALTIFITPLIKRIAFIIGATDKPSKRKVHQSIMPRLGGLAIYSGFIVGVIVLRPQDPTLLAMLLGSVVIITVGIIDDVIELSAKYKLLGQVVAAVIFVVYGNIQVDFINLPFGSQLELGLFSIPITILWIVGITNSINLIDGLDGLAAGVSSIALLTISIMALIMGNMYVLTVASIVLVCTLGFLYHNFHPAQIFMGDTGALFLGYIISVLSLLGYKNVTFISFIVPVIILGVPISDTFFAILRRIVHKKPLSQPDKSHLHHCLMKMGYSHRRTVLMIYSIGVFFSLTAIVFSQLKWEESYLLIILLVLLVEIFAEKIGLVGKEFHPFLKFFQYIRTIGLKKL